MAEKKDVLMTRQHLMYGLLIGFGLILLGYILVGIGFLVGGSSLQAIMANPMAALSGAAGGLSGGGWVMAIGSAFVQFAKLGFAFCFGMYAYAGEEKDTNIRMGLYIATGILIAMAL
jgi:ABC-type Fe3+-siderophore transport system permease subunit